MRRHLIAGLLLIASLGCRDDDGPWTDDFTFVHEGEYVTVYGYGVAQEEVCGGSFDALDLHTASILEFVGSDAAVHYDYRLMSEDFFEGRCPPGANACTASGEPWTRSIPDMHESTHATLDAAWDDSCPSFLSEGLAVYFARPRRVVDDFPDPGLVPEALTGAPLPLGAEYNAAGHFTSFLIEDYGVEAVRDLCYALPYYNEISDWEAAVSDNLGVELDELLTQYSAYPLCTRQQYRARLWECSGEVDAVYNGGSEIQFEAETDCASERVLGPINGQAVIVRRVLFPEDRSVVVYAMNESGHVPFISQECAPCSADPQFYINDGKLPVWPFRAGVHEFVFFVDVDETDPITVRIIPPI